MHRVIKTLLIVFVIVSIGVQAQESVVVSAAKKELNRFMKELKGEPNPPYFIAYQISDTKEISISGTFGNIITDNDESKRTLDIDLRVGDYKFDNTHIIRGESFGMYFREASSDLPLEDDEEAIRNSIWAQTDKKYKSAIERYQKALTNSAVKIKEEDTSADFSYETPAKYVGKDMMFQIDKELWKKRIKNVSAVFANYDWLFTGYVSMNIKMIKKYFINSEGSEIVMTEPYARIFISVKTKSDDGMSLPLYKSFFAFTPNDLPGEEELIREAIKIINILDAMRNAPMMSTYSGPALLGGEAAGVFFHEIFGHRVEGHRLKNPDDAQTYKNSIGEKVLPEFIDVIFDPTMRAIKGNELAGYFEYDDEGTKAQKVVVVDKGIFKNFLMSRSPIEHFDKSNGHGRKQEGYDAVSRQSNLIVKAEKSVPVEELKDMLRDECRKQGKDFGLYFVKVQGGFTFTGRTIPNSFNVNPLLVYKIFVDGKPDELVRGVDLIGTPLTTFSSIIAAGDDVGVFNGVCGAESGGVPVAAVSPTLLVQKIEVQKKSKSQAKLPILPSPLNKESE